MIDTAEYEGHTEGEWTLCTWKDGHATYDVVNEDNNVIASIVGKWEEVKPNMKLIADAPLLLAEVKWLRSLIEMVSYDLEWYPDRLNQVKRQLEYNVQKWEKKEMIE